MKRFNKRSDIRLNENFAIYFAMLKAGFKRKLKADPVQHARRCAIEKISVQRRYCDAFALWRDCGRPDCRRQRSCRGDANACLQRALDRLPREEQIRARDAMLAATPRNIGAPEREARQSMPYDFYDRRR